MATGKWRERLDLCLYKPRKHWGYQKTEQARKDPHLEALEGAWPCQHLDFGLLTSRIMTPYTSVVLIHPACGPEGSPGKLILLRVEMEVHMEKLHLRLRQIVLC